MPRGNDPLGESPELVKAPDFDSGIRRFESFFPAIQFSSGRPQTCQSALLAGLAFWPLHGNLIEMAYNSLMVFTGNANPKLAADVKANT